MDSGDKATNKAMSAAYKYMAMQLFCIPTEGDNDADSSTHEIAATFDPHPARMQIKALPNTTTADMARASKFTDRASLIELYNEIKARANGKPAETPA
jgi:hypothetical protein